MPRITGGQAVIATLRAHDVKTIFGIPGVHTLPIYDALLDAPEIRHVLARHEQARATWRMATRASPASPAW